MTWLSANAGTILVLIILVLVVGAVIRKMISDRKKGVTACDACASADSCAIRAAGKSCDKARAMEPQVKKTNGCH